MPVVVRQHFLFFFYQFLGKGKYKNNNNTYKSALPGVEEEVARKINPASFYSPWQEVKSHITLAEMSASN